MPSFNEMQYFIENYHKEKDIVYSQQFNRLHRILTLNHSDASDLFILAFDHRKQFEETIAESNEDRELIKTFKQQIFKGFDIVRQQASDNLAILVDPLYGEEVLKSASDNNITIGVPIESAGSMPVSWISHKPLYQEILQRPSNWFVKVLWQYHSDLSEAVKQRQIEQLQNLARVCDHLDRKLMLELIVPQPFSSTGDALCQTIQEVYSHLIYPCWWKLGNLKSAAEWQAVASVIKDNDLAARIILLGGVCDNDTERMHRLEQQFSAVKATGIAKGFAIGRSIFWQIWQDYLTGKVKQDDIPNMIAQQYQSLIYLWKKS